MYSRQEASQLKQAFFTAFGQYMLPVPSAEGESINWVNYKTGEKDIYFKLHADDKKAAISIVLSHKDAGLQALYFEQFRQLKPMLYNALHEEWIWRLHTHDEQGKVTSIIYTEISNVSIFKKEDWPRLISFFKPRLIALDAFWSGARYAFEALR